MASNEIEIVVEVTDNATEKFADIERAARDIGETMEDAMRGFMDMVDDATDHAKERFSKMGDGGGDNRIGEEAVTSVRRLAGAFTDAGSEAGRFASQAAGAGIQASGLAAAGTFASGGMNMLGTALIGVVAAIPVMIGGFLALAPLLSSIAALAGAAVTALAGVGIAAGTLGIGLGGVSEAWSAYGKSAGGGGGASKAAGEQAHQAARRVEQAEDALTRAKRQAEKASRDVTRAREDERERIEDLTLALRGQKFAQEDAADAVREAEEKLAIAKAHGNQNNVNDAQKVVDRAKYQYDYETERLKDLERDKAEADKKGIEGSDRVQDALERQRDAADAVTDAMQALADAQRKTETSAGGAAGGVNAFADAMKKLAPEAQKFVLKLIELKERFAGVKREVQNRLFAGLDDTLEKMANAWGPKLVSIFGGMADALNRVAKAIGDSLSDPEFVENIEDAGKAFEVFLGYLGGAAQSIIDAFGRIAGASGPVLEKIGKGIESLADSFAEWIKAADESGDLESFLEKGAGYLKDIWEIGGLAFGIMKDFIKILFPASDEVGGGVLDGIKEALRDVSEWLGDPENQQQIKDMFRDFGRFFDRLVNEWIPAIEDFGSTVYALTHPFDTLGGRLRSVHNWLTVRLPGAIEGLSRRGGNIFRGVWEGFRAGVNSIIRGWNSLSFTMPSFNVFGQTIGGGTLGTPHIDYLARGGISGAGLTMINERGPELVKLPTGSQVMTHGDSMRALAGQGGGELTVRAVADRTTERGLVDMLFSMLRFEIDRSHGGDVQRALGSAR